MLNLNLFSRSIDYGVGVGPRAIVAGDWNADGHTDLAVANMGPGGGNTVSVFIGNGRGGFSAGTDYQAGEAPSSIASGDFDNDGKADLILSDQLSGTVSVLLGTGDGNFRAPLTTQCGSGPVAVVVGDWNGDKKTDVAVANSGSRSVSVLLGDGTGALPSRMDYTLDGPPTALATGDFNRDGQFDLAIITAPGVSILLGSPTGAFVASTGYSVGLMPAGAAVADFNHDQNNDLVVTASGQDAVAVAGRNHDGGLEYGSKTRHRGRQLLLDVNEHSYQHWTVNQRLGRREPLPAVRGAGGDGGRHREPPRDDPIRAPRIAVSSFA